MNINGMVLGGVLLLTGCVVGNMDSSNYRFVPWIQVFQKVDPATGQTNIRDRKEALYSVVSIEAKISIAKTGD